MIRTLMSLCLLLIASAAHAQTSPTDEAGIELGKRITGMYDVTFRPFVGAKQVERQFPAELLRYTREDKNWSLVFDKAQLPQAIPLRDTRTAVGVDQPGYLTAAKNLIKSTDPNADIIQTDIIDTGDLRIGLIIAHVRLKRDEHSLMQQALIEITPRLYYSVVMQTPAPEKDFGKDPAVQEASKVFKAIVDSIAPQDLSAIKADQDDRLFRTRALFINWTRKTLLAAAWKEQMLRFRRQNDAGQWEDIGYAYIVEEPAEGLPRANTKEAPVDPQHAAGLRVGMRMRSFPETGKTVDIESWMWVSFDRKHEVWSNITVLQTPGADNPKDREQWFTEVGASDIEKERVFDKQMQPGDFKEVDKRNTTRKPGDPELIPFREVEKYKLVVRTESRNAVAQPLQRELPPFYLPQALGTMLPRLVPLGSPTGYLFASYASDTRQVMLRYIDVGTETTATLDGKKVRAIPITERLGAEGSPTTHYLSAAGQYLGTISPEQKLEITPVKREDLLKIWKDAVLDKPKEVKDLP